MAMIELLVVYPKALHGPSADPVLADSVSASALCPVFARHHSWL